MTEAIIYDHVRTPRGQGAGVRARGEPRGAVGGHHEHDTLTLVGRARHGARGQQRLDRAQRGRSRHGEMLVDLRGKGVTGREAEVALDRVGITVNRNAVPKDPQGPTVTSGIRIGSPAMTTRGMREMEAEKLAHLIADVLDAPGDERVAKRVADGVKELCKRFPVYVP